MGKFCLQSTLKTVLALKLLKDKTDIVWTSKVGNLECKEILKFKSIENLCYTPLKNGYTMVSLINRDYYDDSYDKYYNILTPSLKLLSPTWFIDCRDIQEDYIVVQRKDGRWNFMGLDGKFLSQEWYDFCGSFSEGYAVVKRKSDGYWNWIGKDGKLFDSTWYLNCHSFHEGYAACRLGDKYKFINKDSKNFLKSPTNFELCDDFHEGFARVGKGGNWNFIDHNGNLLSPTWYYLCGNFQEGYAMVHGGHGNWNFIDHNGNLLSKKWYRSCKSFKNGYAPIEDPNKGCNWIGKDGKLFNSTWYKFCANFHEGYAIVQRKEDGHWNFIGLNGKYLWRSWKKDIIAEGFKNGIAIINAGTEYSFIDKNGHTSQFRFDDYYFSLSGVQSNYYALKDGKIYIVDKFGTIF